MSEQYLTVSALTKYLKRKFDADPYLTRVYLTGEISNFRLRPNAHQYFSLKDNQAKINAIMFKSAFSKLKFVPEEGMKVMVVGHLSVYEASGSYQIYVDQMEPDGVGQLYQAYEQLKNRLQAEGLFDLPKKPLPKYPKRIAVITSPSGAVIRDIITTVRRRYPIAQIVLFPAIVQGTAAADSLIKQIIRVNQMNTFDTLIIGRGGGSIEDLWPFNEEGVARAIIESEIPVISSVGHETDTTIADFVADKRAATPTAAAELAVPRLDQLVVQLNNYQNQLVNFLSQTIKNQQLRLDGINNKVIFKQPAKIYEGLSQRLDLLTRQLEPRAERVLQNNNQQFLKLSHRLNNVNQLDRIRNNRLRLTQLTATLKQLMTNQLTNKQQRSELLMQSLDHLSPLKILQRGYTYTTMADQLVTSSQQLKPADEIKIEFKDGTAMAKITSINIDEKGLSKWAIT